MNWKPIRRGEIYCASACGGACTRAQYEQARRRGATLAKKLGRGWTVRVWENLGWFYEVISPDKMLTIHPSPGAIGDVIYFLSVDVPGVGQIATVTGTDLFNCLSELSNTLYQKTRIFDAAADSMKRIIRGGKSWQKLKS